MVRAIRRASTGKQESHVVVNLRDRIHGRARVVRRRFLLNRNRRRQPLNHIHIGLVHQLQKLPSVGGQTLHITALPLGIQRVKRQGRFTRTRESRNHHELIARNIKINVFKVVRPRPTDRNVRHRRWATGGLG